MKQSIVFATTTVIVMLAFLLPSDMARRGEHIAPLQPQVPAAIQALEQPAVATLSPIALKPVKAAEPAPVQSPAKATGSCESWMAQAGVPLTHATKTLIINESGCRPDAVNPSSGACGIPQALPCSKLPCTLQDPVCQLKWMNSYVKSRYGTWEGALSAWQSRSPHWY